MTFNEALHPRGKGEHGGEWIKKLSDTIGGGDHLTGDDAYNSAPWAQDLPNANKDALDSYAGGGFDWINKLHRNGADTVPAPGLKIIQRRSDALDSMIESAPPLKHNIQVLRGVDYSDDVFGPVGSMTGKVFSDKGFVSTTTDDKVQKRFSMANNSAAMKIKVPAGTRAISLGFGGDKREREILLPRGSRFKVISDVLNGKTRHIELELL